MSLLQNLGLHKETLEYTLSVSNVSKRRAAYTKALFYKLKV